VNGALVLSAAASVGSDWINATSGGSAGSDITLGGAVSGAFLLTKVGSNTLNLTGNNTQNGVTISLGKVVVSGASGVAGSGGNLTVNAGTASGLTLGNVLTFDNNGAASSVRAGGAASNRSLTLSGGAFEFKGDATTAAE